MTNGPERMKANMRAGAFVGVMLISIITAACGRSGHISAGSSSATAPTTLKPNPVPIRTDDTIGLFGVNWQATASDGAVTATVTAVGEPMHTTYTTRDNTVVAKVIQDVTVTVNQVIFDSTMAMAATDKSSPWTGAPLAVAQSIVVSADQTGEAVDIPGRATIKKDQRTGPFAVGDNVLLLLQRFYGFPGPNGTTRTAYTVLDGWQGHWIIDQGGATAHNPDGRRVAVQAYIQRLRSERQIGRHPERDPGTTDDPTAPSA
jgi:hypothetical protein